MFFENMFLEINIKKYEYFENKKLFFFKDQLANPLLIFNYLSF